MIRVILDLILTRVVLKVHNLRDYHSMIDPLAFSFDRWFVRSFTHGDSLAVHYCVQRVETLQHHLCLGLNASIVLALHILQGYLTFSYLEILNMYRAGECFHSFFEFSQTFTSVYNSIKTRSTCFLFLLENTGSRKRKTTC